MSAETWINIFGLAAAIGVGLATFFRTIRIEQAKLQTRVAVEETKAKVEDTQAKVEDTQAKVAEIGELVNGQREHLLAEIKRLEGVIRGLRENK